MSRPAPRAMQPEDITRIAWVSDPQISPDGRRVAFVVTTLSEQRDESLSNIWRVDTAGGAPRRFYDRRPHVHIVGAEGGPSRQLTAGDFVHADPAWSPDGRWIAFGSARHPERDADDTSDVWVIEAEGGEPRRVTDTLGPAVRPSFSPDGNTIAYLGRRSRNDDAGNVRVFAIRTAGGAPACLTDAFDRSCAPLDTRPLWSPDGRHVIFAAEDQGALSLCHTARFKAACSERAVNDHWGMFGSSDIGHLFNAVELGGALPTPLLIVHAEDDLRCPIAQAEQLFTALT